MRTQTELALEAIANAEELADTGAATLSSSHLADVERVMALPHNQDGADKSWVWPAYEFCRGHFQTAKPT